MNDSDKGIKEKNRDALFKIMLMPSSGLSSPGDFTANIATNEDRHQ